MRRKNLFRIIKFLKDGLIISLISDAGTPSISDPGAVLVNECVKNNINIIPIPGPSSVTSAVSMSGFSEKFFFYGFFLKRKNTLCRLRAIIKFKFINSIFCITKKFSRVVPYLKNIFLGEIS